MRGGRLTYWPSLHRLHPKNRNRSPFNTGNVEPPADMPLGIAASFSPMRAPPSGQMLNAQPVTVLMNQSVRISSDINCGRLAAEHIKVALECRAKPEKYARDQAKPRFQSSRF